MTVGSFYGTSSTGSKIEGSKKILIFPRIDTDKKEGDYWSPRYHPKPTPPGKLPNGIAINQSQWPDVKRSFAFLMAMMDSLSLAEVRILFDLDEEDFDKSTHSFEGDEDKNEIDDAAFQEPQRDRAKLRRSKSRAKALADALAAWQKTNPEFNPLKKVEEEEEAAMADPVPLAKKIPGKRDAIAGNDDDDIEDSVAIGKTVALKRKK